ncbi:ABC transporter permease [Leptospira sp. GIMC2001]|uniref:ABC transporter permease n=1 Tax=Leptospira sp. GIMC2001 TaxID=1513297 RepID=UPI00234B17A3|nr:ABC transporter permease [Leptospira sp. GIMC2001]WCL48704.1 ABC transporter permease [Leptospira sp. GIMC2001]
MNLILLITSRYIRGSRVVGLLSMKSRLSFTVMAVGVSLLIVVLSIFNGFQKQVKESLWQGGPHITIENSYDTGAIFRFQEIIKRLKEDPTLKDKIVSIEGNITSHGLLQNSNNFIPIMIRAVPIPSEEDLIDNKLPNFPRLTHYNRDYITQINSARHVVIGKEMAALYHFNLGRKITLAVPGGRFSVGRGVEVNVKDFQVVGYFKTGYYNYDSRFIFMSLPLAQEFFRLNGAVNQIAIKVNALDDLKEVKVLILNSLNDASFDEKIREANSFSVRTIAEEQENFLAALKLEKTIISIIVFLFIVLAALGMVATVYSLVRAKRKSIGTLKALGLPSRDILLIFTLNAMIVGILASIAGGVMGIFFASNLEVIVAGLGEAINLIGSAIYRGDWRNVELVPKDIYYFDHIPVDIDISFIFMVTTAATILSGIAGYFPARWAALLNPVDTIRND